VGIAEHNSLSDDEATSELSKICASPRWVDEMIAGRPYDTVDDLLNTADHVLDQLSEADLDAALAGHPKIGAAPTGREGEQSRREQSGVDAEDGQLTAALAEANVAYEEKFGRIYLVCATGRTGAELLTILHDRLENHPTTELRVTRGELGKINRLRLERMVAS
jgi:2-oxo-4-hydroxy-4-carboxy-5-ureidoimidazoline decarboxylase